MGAATCDGAFRQPQHFTAQSPLPTGLNAKRPRATGQSTAHGLRTCRWHDVTNREAALQTSPRPAGSCRKGTGRAGAAEAAPHSPQGLKRSLQCGAWRRTRHGPLSMPGQPQCLCRLARHARSLRQGLKIISTRAPRLARRPPEADGGVCTTDPKKQGTHKHAIASARRGGGGVGEGGADGQSSA